MWHWQICNNFARKAFVFQICLWINYVSERKAIFKLLQKFSGLCFTISRQHCIGDQVFPTLCSAGWHLVPAPLKVNQDQMHCVGMNAVHCSLGPRPTGPFLICSNEDSSCKQKEFSALVQSAGSTVSHPHYRLQGASFGEFRDREKKDHTNKHRQSPRETRNVLTLLSEEISEWRKWQLILEPILVSEMIREWRVKVDS